MFVASKDNHKRSHILTIDDAKLDHPMPRNHFRLSQNPPLISDNSSSQLQKLKQLVRLTLDNKLTNIVNIFQLKVLNKLSYSFNAIRQTQEPYIEPYRNEKCLIMIGEHFQQKLNYVIGIERIKNAIHFMHSIKMLFGKRNQNSKRQILRINSKIDKQYDEFDHYDKNYSNDGIANTQKTNKALKKKKQINQKQFNCFKQQMDQLLTMHENYLMKKH